MYYEHLAQPKHVFFSLRGSAVVVLVSTSLLSLALAVPVPQRMVVPHNPTQAALAEVARHKVGRLDWPQWGGWIGRNNTPEGSDIPVLWEPGDFDQKTGEWFPEKAVNIKWVARLGTQTYGNPVVANGHIYVGTNNGGAYLARYPQKVDLGCLLCFRESDGKFLWQHSSEKLPTGRVHDWPLQGICSSPLVEGDRLWFVSSRGEVICLDTEGFLDQENDGPLISEVNKGTDEADEIWKLDMMGRLGISQHNMCTCCVTSWGNTLFVCTGNGVDESHISIPKPEAPSFIALDKRTGSVLWSDNSPGENILHGQWSAPVVGRLGGVPQVIFNGGDGWVYGFHAERFTGGKPELLWKFDANPKESNFIAGGRGNRNEIIAIPVIYDGLVYVVVGQDPEHGEGEGHMWCIDPTRRGDISPQLAVHINDRTKVIPHKRLQAVVPELGEVAIENPNSGLVWHYDKADLNGDGKIDFEETFHRGIGSVAIKNDLLFVADFSGLFHCLNAKTGRLYWTYDMLAAAWGSPLIVDNKVYIGDEDGDVLVFRLPPPPGPTAVTLASGGFDVPLAEINMTNSVYGTPIVANNVLYIANKTHLFAIQHIDRAPVK